MLKDDIRGFIGRIQSIIKEDILLNGRVGGLSISAGAAIFDATKHLTLEDIIDEADMLMYAAKKNPPYHLKISGDLQEIPKEIQEKRKDDPISVRKRMLFDWVANQVYHENPNFDYEKIVKAARETWRINGNRLIYRATINEIIKIVMDIYNKNIRKENGEQVKPNGITLRLDQNQANILKGLLIQQKELEIKRKEEEQKVKEVVETQELENDEDTSEDNSVSIPTRTFKKKVS